MGLTDNLDPTGEDQVSTGFALLAAMQKTLVGFNGAAGAAGEVPKPVLATSLPKPTNHGLTYTFHLRHVMFGPPVNRAVTSKDVAYAFQRINDKALVPAYGYYYDGLIKGFTGTAKSENAPISGISTPNKKTIVFHLLVVKAISCSSWRSRPQPRSRPRLGSASRSQGPTAPILSRPVRT